MKTDHLMKTVLFLTTLILFFAFPNRDQGFDSYSYALSITDGVELFHPHHLLYNFCGHAVHRALRFSGVGSLELMSQINALLAAVLVVVLYSLLRRQLPISGAVIGTVLVAGFYSFWYYATSVEVNMPALLCLYSGISVLLSSRNLATWLVGALLVGIAPLFHQVAFLAFPPLAFLVANRSAHPSKTVIFFVCAVATTVTPYLIVGYFSTEPANLTTFSQWLTSYAQTGAWGHIGTENFLTAAWGKTKCLFGGNGLLQVLFYHDFSAPRLVQLGLIAIATALLLLLTLKGVINFARNPAVELASWLGMTLVFGLFAFWWAPTDDGFWLYALVPLVIFVFLSLKKEVAVRRVAVIIAAAMLTANLFDEIIPRASAANSISLQGSALLNRLQISEADLVLTNFNQIRLAAEYHYGRKVRTACLNFLPLGEKEEILKAFQMTIRNALANNRVVAFDDELSPEPHRRHLFRRFSAEEYAQVYAPYLPYLVEIGTLKIYGHLVKIYLIDKAALGGLRELTYLRST